MIFPLMLICPPGPSGKAGISLENYKALIRQSGPLYEALWSLAAIGFEFVAPAEVRHKAIAAA